MKSDPFEADGVQMPSWEELDERMLCIFGEDIGTGQSMGNQQCSGSPGGSERTNVHEIAGMSFGAGSLDGSVPLFSKGMGCARSVSGGKKHSGKAASKGEAPRMRLIGSNYLIFVEIDPSTKRRFSLPYLTFLVGGYQF